MNTIKLDFLATNENAEMISSLLELMGALAISYENNEGEDILEPEPNTTPLWESLWVCGYFEENIHAADIVELIKNHSSSKKCFDYRITTLADEDWNSKWLEYIKPMCFGEKKELWILPTGCEMPKTSKNPQVVHINPGLAFGTGTHETTALCLEWIADHLQGGETLIDYGCGSGILGLAALKLGANQVIGIDYDPQALLASLENTKINGFKSENFKLLSPQELIKPFKTDVIIANILAKPILELFPTFIDLLKSSGKLILSGILTSQAKEVINTYETAFQLDPVISRNEWVLIKGTKK
jgi:ribosomal protein L11 methyltransferase